MLRNIARSSEKCFKPSVWGFAYMGLCRALVDNFTAIFIMAISPSTGRVARRFDPNQAGNAGCYAPNSEVGRQNEKRRQLWGGTARAGYMAQFAYKLEESVFTAMLDDEDVVYVASAASPERHAAEVRAALAGVPESTPIG